MTSGFHRQRSNGIKFVRRRLYQRHAPRLHNQARRDAKHVDSSGVFPFLVGTKDREDFLGGRA